MLVPFRLAEILNHIHSILPNPTWEFGLYLKTTLNDKGHHQVDLDAGWLLPKQKVTAGSITFEEGFRSRDDWNAVVHRHPAGVTRFSATDVKDLNNEFDVSILFIPPFDFPDAVVNHKIADNKYVQIPADVVVVTDSSNFTEEQHDAMENIAERITTTPVPKASKHYSPAVPNLPPPPFRDGTTIGTPPGCTRPRRTSTTARASTWASGRESPPRRSRPRAPA